MKFLKNNGVGNIVRPLTFVFGFLAFFTGYSQSSVLAEGDWYKVGVTTSGIYNAFKERPEFAGIACQLIEPSEYQDFREWCRWSFASA